MNNQNNQNNQGKQSFDASSFSSRKLLELAEEATLERLQDHRCAAIDELSRRGHYLTELADRGLIRATAATQH